MNEIRSFGWLSDRPDFRDTIFAADVPLSQLPATVDLRPLMPPVYDQGSLGSCTSQMAAAAVWMKEAQRTGQADLAQPSRLFIYYNTRLLMGLVKQGDTGASIRDTIRAVKKFSAPDESEHPYNIARFNRRASKLLYESAKPETLSISYESVAQRKHDIKAALAGGHPVCFGFSVYESYMLPFTAMTGIVPFPQLIERTLGGHAELIVGYDEASEVFICRNSWSDKWGDSGYAYFPYQYILHPRLASDFWVIKTA